MTLVSIRINFSSWLNHEEQTAHHPGSRSNECAAADRRYRLPSTATECHSAWHRRNKPERLSTAVHLETQIKTETTITDAN